MVNEHQTGIISSKACAFKNAITFRYGNSHLGKQVDGRFRKYIYPQTIFLRNLKEKLQMSGVSNSKIISCRISTVCLENIPMLYEACKTLDIICMSIFVGRTTGIETEKKSG